jgi:DNA-binding transcriptional ArsR family regulator
MPEWTPIDGADTLGEELVLDDLDVIGEVTHPIRSALLHRLKSPHSAAELAAEMQVPVTRLYHHLNRLEQRGLIRVVATRRSGAKTERRYRVATRGMRVDPEAARGRSPQEVSAAIGTLFDVAKSELRHEIESGAIDPERIEDTAVIGFLGLSLTEQQHATFVDRLRAIVDELTRLDEGNALDPETARFRVMLAGFPISD